MYKCENIYPHGCAGGNLVSSLKATSHGQIEFQIIVTIT